MMDDPLGAVGAGAEARGLFRMLGHDGNTVEDLRELIAVPPRIERVLRAYAQACLEGVLCVERNLKLRLAVAREFERLVPEGVPVANLPEVEKSERDTAGGSVGQRADVRQEARK
jgi:hypothetical protein